jgi:aldose 1-epimerase
MYFGTSKTGVDVEKLTISAGELSVSILTWGAVIQDVRVSIGR